MAARRNSDVAVGGKGGKRRRRERGAANIVALMTNANTQGIGKASGTSGTGG
jgi:hypothetical protein